MVVEQTVEPVAVVGMACRLPGAGDLEQFWQNLVAGRDSITHLAAERLRASGVPEDLLDNPDYVAAAAMIPDADQFDAGLFGMSVHEAQMCDPQIRAFLETCHAAMENAGYDPYAIDESVGVYGTAGPNQYLGLVKANRPDLLVGGGASMALYTLNLGDYLATLVSYKLNLHGPSMAVSTACSSSLVATHLAVQALRAGECDMALAGGAAIQLPQETGYLWTPGGVGSADGRCRPFDAEGSGTIFGSGAGVVVLKRLTDAIADRDDVRAVILGNAVNNDGADKVSFSAPSVSGQTDVVIEAMATGGVDPGQIDYVEAHATGTVLGDPIEVSALTEAYAALAAQPLAPGSCAVGSVKSNIGHMVSVAGIAGLIKTVLMFEREVIVPSININEVNPRLELEKTPFEVVSGVRPWRRDAQRPRLAAVSSLGVGGTNAHLVLGEAPVVIPRPRPQQPRGVVLWSGRTEQAEQAAAANLADYFAGRGAEVFADAVSTLQYGRTPHLVRGAAVCDSAAEAAQRLRERRELHTGRARDHACVTFLFPGQGAQRARMAAGLYGTVRDFTVVMDECLELLEEHGVAAYDAWLSGDSIDDTVLAQPLLFAVEFSLAAMWRAWGVRPGAVLGHSVGELVAAAVAGIFTLRDAVALVVARANAMAAHPVPGGMVAVAAATADLPELPKAVAVAALNGERQTVLSGPVDVLDALAANLEAAGTGAVRIPVSHAFHHPDWAAAAAEFAEAFAGVEPQPARIPVYSAATGALLTAEQAADPTFWSGQLLSPVRFWPAARALPEHLLLEVGPGRTLTKLAGRRETAVVCLAGEDDHRAVLDAAARLWVNGVSVDWAAAGQPPPNRRVAVPGYPYQRQRYWADPLPGVAPAEPIPAPVAEPEPTAVASPISVIDWVPRSRPDGGLPRRGTALVVLPADPERALTVQLAVQRAGYAVIRVESNRPADLERVVAELTERSVAPDALIHAATVAAVEPLTAQTLPEQLDVAFGGVFTLARLALRFPNGRPSVTVITSAAVDVSGDDRLAPARSTIPPVVATLLDEAPGLRGGVIDLGDRVGADDLAEELKLDRPEGLVALRGRRRWVPVERPVPLPERVRPVLREQGVYLLTGGFGAIGLAVAKGLAATGLRPRLVLLGRNDPGDVPAVTELRALGAEVFGVAADVTDQAALRTVIEEATTRFGPVNGLFHLAGVAGDGMIAFRDLAETRAVLAPKTVGTVNLAEVLSTAPPLDFAVFFSSRAAADGLVGCADYAAANAFLDAVAPVSGLALGRVFSVAWPVWLGGGMVDRAGVDLTRLAGAVAELGTDSVRRTPEPILSWEGEFSAATHWVLDEHRAGRTPLLPGTGYLDLVVGLFTEKLAEPGAAVELSGVVFRAPFLSDEIRVLRVTFAERLDFEVSSRSAANLTEPWLVHVTGHVMSRDEAPGRVDLESLRARMGAASAGAPADLVGTRGFALGPRWKNTTRVIEVGEEKLLEMALLPALAADLAEHRMHPALLDTVTSSVRGEGQDSHIPFLYERLVLYTDLPGSFVAHMRRRESGSENAVGDVDLIAEDGTLVARVEGFAMRQVDLVGGWDVPTAPPTPTVSDGEFGMDQAEGVRLLLRLLGTEGLPHSVLVRPYLDGQPRPLTTSPRPVVAPTLSPKPEPESVPVQGDTVERLRRMWEQVIGVAPTAAGTDFFDAGGNSLAAVDLMARIRSEFGVNLGIGLLLEQRTFGELCALLDA